MKIIDLVEEPVFTLRDFANSVATWVKNLAEDDVEFGFMTEYACDLWFKIGNQKKIVVNFGPKRVSINAYAGPGGMVIHPVDFTNVLSPKTIAQRTIKCSAEWTDLKFNSL